MKMSLKSIFARGSDKGRSPYTTHAEWEPGRSELILQPCSTNQLQLISGLPYKYNMGKKLVNIGDQT